jgi:hypothetical protein
VDVACGRLRELAQVAIKCHNDGIDLTKITSISGLLRLAVDKRYITKYEYESRQFEMDPWGTQYQWTAIKKTDGLTVIVSSLGTHSEDVSARGHQQLFVKIRLRNEETVLQYSWRM